MSKAEAEAYGGEAFNQIGTQIDGCQFPKNRRNQLVLAYVSVMLEHHRAILALVEQDLVGSASALLRSQIESGFRGLWVTLIGTDEQIEKIIKDDDEPFPRFRKLAELLDETYNAGGIFAHIAQHWDAFNSLTHSGMAQLGRRFDTDGNIAPNHTDGQIEELLRFSASVSLLCVIPLFRYTGAPERSEALEVWLEEHGEKPNATG